MILRSMEVCDRIPVHVCAGDPISREGIASQLRAEGMELVPPHQLDAEVVCVVVADEVDEEALREIRSQRRRGVERVLLIVTRVGDSGLMSAVEAGACGLLRRSQATSQALAAAVRSASAGDGSVPADLLGRLLSHVGQLQRQVVAPRALTFGSLSEREIKVLELLADGLDTAQVGARLFYSERTVKNIVHEITSRLNLSNRTHAVAYALRKGLI